MGKRKKRYASFIAIERQTLKDPAWRTGLTPSEKILYIHLKHKYVGTNNGEICLHYSEMKDMMSPATIARAFKGLKEKGWIEVAAHLWGRYRFQLHYKLTGKYDTAIHRYNF
jgi:hypothetical protein